jgi:hypothetical protein
MTTLNASPEPISQPILNPNDLYWKDKEEALWCKLGLDPNRELKSLSLINMTHPSLEGDLDERNPRDTNPREIMDNKMSNG